MKLEREKRRDLRENGRTLWPVDPGCPGMPLSQLMAHLQKFSRPPFQASSIPHLDKHGRYNIKGIHIGRDLTGTFSIIWLPVMFGRNNGSTIKKVMLWVGSCYEQFVSTTNNILTVDYHRFKSLWYLQVCRSPSRWCKRSLRRFRRYVAAEHINMAWMMNFAFSWKGRYTDILWPSPPRGPPPTAIQAPANWKGGRPRRTNQASTSRRT